MEEAVTRDVASLDWLKWVALCLFRAESVSKSKSICNFAGARPEIDRETLLSNSTLHNHDISHSAKVSSTHPPHQSVFTKSELDKSVDLSLWGLAPAQSQMDLFLITLCARNKQRATNFNQSEETMSRATASAMFFLGRGN